MLLPVKGRQVRHPLCLHPLYAIILLIIYCNYMCRVGSLSVKTCNEVGTFQQILDISLAICAEECFRRQRCQMYMFRYGMNYCALKDDISLLSLDDKDPVCMYFTRGDWLPNDLGPCTGHNCNVTERCSSKRDNDTQFECVKSECSKPDVISNAKLLSNTHSIGMRNKYICDTGFLGFGYSTVTCGDDATWSVTYFQCIQSCPVPQQHYFNADLTSVEGNGFTTGTVLTFACREGYRKTGYEWKSTCQASGMWDSERIYCCPDNSTYEVDAECTVIIDGGVATSYSGVDMFCQSIGGTFVWNNWQRRDSFNKTTTDLALQASKISSINDNWKYTECAAANGAEGDASKSLREKIDEVEKNNWQGSDCWWGTIWFPGQPYSNPTDDCLVRDLHDPKYKHLAYPCNFYESDSVGFACIKQKMKFMKASGYRT